MRLLDTATVELHEFFGDNIPEYAILSHTWGDGEISYQSLEQAKTEASPRPGYGKICQCCELARSNGYRYLWIDTCCIDKTSSAELSEAINSMYRWYRDSAICYAYLKDVSQTSLEDESSTETWCASRWFTRGWTLQELLAPTHLIFFNEDWVEIGSKIDLEMKIHLATGIEPQFIRAPNDACVAQKMSWASKRRTTRHEDRSYCLMGLFDVQMPLLYGEGGQKAFLRLQHKIAKLSEDESLFAWNDSSLQLCGAFAPSPEAFVDSGDIIRAAFNREFYREPWSVGNRGLAIEFHNPPMFMRKFPFFHVLELHCCRKKYPDQPFCVRLRENTYGAYKTFSRIGQGEVTMRDHRRHREYKNIFIKERMLIYIPQERAPPSPDITKYHTAFISQHYDGKIRPLTLWEPFRSAQEWISWDEGTQTLTMNFGTTVFCIEIDSFIFLMALTVAKDVSDTLNLDVRLNKGAEYSPKWVDLDQDLFQNSAAHMDTFHGQLSPRHRLDIKLRKGSELGEGCWYVDINVSLCETGVPDQGQSHKNRPDNNRPSMSQRFKSIFS